MYECTNCGVDLDSQEDFIVYSKMLHVVLCQDCYNHPAWYELINQ